jgi:hypothetical protein
MRRCRNLLGALVVMSACVAPAVAEECGPPRWPEPEGSLYCCISVDVTSQDQIKLLQSLRAWCLREGRFVWPSSQQLYDTLVASGFEPGRVCLRLTEEKSIEPSVRYCYLGEKSETTAARPVMGETSSSSASGVTEWTVHLLGDGFVAKKSLEYAGRIAVSRNGQFLAIVSSRGLAENEHYYQGVWEVFDRDGNLKGTVTFPWEYDESPDPVILSDRGSLVKVGWHGWLLSFYDTSCSLIAEVKTCERGVVRAVADFTDDGEYLALQFTRGSSRGGESATEVVLYEDDGTETWRFQPQDETNTGGSIWISPDGSYVATVLVSELRAQIKGSVTYILDRAGSVVVSIPDFRAYDAKFSASEQFVMFKTMKGVRLYSLPDVKTVFSYEEGPSSPRDYDFSEETGLTALVRSNSLTILDAQGKEVWKTHWRDVSGIPKVSVSGDGREVCWVLGSKFRVFEIDDWEEHPHRPWDGHLEAR